MIGGSQHHSLYAKPPTVTTERAARFAVLISPKANATSVLSLASQERRPKSSEPGLYPSRGANVGACPQPSGPTNMTRWADFGRVFPYTQLTLFTLQQVEG